MLIPLFHSVPLCSPKKASKSYTNGHLHFNYLYAKAFVQLFFWMPAVKRRKLQALSSSPIFFLGPCVPDAFEHIH
jgi:hypothetical protein